MRKYFLTGTILTAAMMMTAMPARACLWDSDTIAEERSKFPTAMEILAGKYNRHSPAFYEWRIKDRQKKLETDPNNLALLDDLGVALCKTGKFKEAVAIGERALALDAKRYKSLSNLGTYHIFAGDLEKSAELIKAALVIEPNAHFGREKYQLYLVEYMRAAKKIRGNGDLPLTMGWPEDRNAYDNLTKEDQAWADNTGYRDACQMQEGPSFESSKAVTGVLGMMRFANDELPVLNEAFGDLLLSSDKQRICARAYLKAAYHAPTPVAAKVYRDMAARSMRAQVNDDIAAVEADFKDELKQGQAWQAQIAADETRWIAEGKDPEAEYDRKYRSDPSLSVRWHLLRSYFTFDIRSPRTILNYAGLLVFLLTAYYLYDLRRRRKRRKAAKAASPAAPPT